MLLALVRRTVRILPQVRSLRNQPNSSEDFPRASRRARTNFDDEEGKEEFIVGETVEVEYRKLPRESTKNILGDPSVMTLDWRQERKKHRVDFEKEEKPKAGFSENELAAFDSIAEIKIDDAFQDFKKSSFDADFLDSVGPGLKPTYNVAALADKHDVIRQLVAMNVEVYKWDEKPEVLKKMLSLKWDKDCRPRLEFLVQKCGLDLEGVRKILTKNPVVLTEDTQHLDARLEFLRDSKVGLGLSREQITRVLSKEPFWLSTSIEEIENRLSFLRTQFVLDERNIRRLIVSRPGIIKVPLRKLLQKKFNMIEEMGFDTNEMRKAILDGTKILTLQSEELIKRFQILHLDVGYPHGLIAAYPRMLYCRSSRLKERVAFLKHVGRDQFDFSKPGYISPEALTKGTDEVFVENVAKSTKEEFEKFLKNV